MSGGAERTSHAYSLGERQALVEGRAATRNAEVCNIHASVSEWSKLAMGST
jgi:hypothetical protein